MANKYNPPPVTCNFIAAMEEVISAAENQVDQIDRELRSKPHEASVEAVAREGMEKLRQNIDLVSGWVKRTKEGGA